MHLLPKEETRLLLHQAGFLAQKRLARGIRLNQTEAAALIASQLQERIRDGKKSVADLKQHGKNILGRRHVLPSVPGLLHEIQVEGTFVDGIFLVTVSDPISTESGDLNAALYGSFLPIPDESIMPGAIIAKKEPIVINKGKERIILKVTNNGDRPVQIGSHYHFIETNSHLSFDRAKSYGTRLDIPSGTAVRFEPGDTKKVTLCSFAGGKIISGGNGLATGIVDLGRTDEIISNLVQRGFSHVPEPGALEVTTDTKIERDVYISMYGPTTGDRIRLGDTRKTVREGMGQATNRLPSESLDLVITNTLVVDWSGIYKADIGVRDGRIVGIGKAGNPDIMTGVHPSLVIGSSTEVIAGEKLIVTAGAIDAHVHYISPQQVEEALSAGTTTMFGGGTGPSAGSKATACTSSPFYMRHMLAATDGLPMNFGFTGKGNDSGPGAVEEIVRAGARYDVQVNIHTDTLNESGFVESTIQAIGNRTIHTYHSEGAGGGHVPDIIAACGQKNVLPSSSSLTRPYTNNMLDEHLEMLMACHHLDKSNPEDLGLAESCIRSETIAAEDVLHDSGTISMINSASQAMGRAGEVISSTWRTASKMREFTGPSSHWRYVAKYTINPAITHGISHLVGHVAIGTLADLVLWKPESFGAKPEMVIKSGVIAWSQMGDANASIPSVHPLFSKPMWISITSGTVASYRLSKRFEPVMNCRAIKKRDMKWNDATPKVTVDPETCDVKVDGILADIKPAVKLPLTRLYNIF
ncbi:hypothetical protein BDP27DRAFT_1385570 [Rhodocollybia butyracea]|uniref:Urease n=1 Tax=Rhodocollybia butyracea TaxID=206335 RepID=A0A9P5PC30_9AGAR|nr:hypothetical protein BDP27DRAFT_1385570 [Rhodocollybia butyracea]